VIYCRYNADVVHTKADPDLRNEAAKF